MFSPVINMAASLGHGNYALGYQTAFDTGKSALTKHNLALNYNAGDMILHATSSDFKVTLSGCCYCVFSCLNFSHSAEVSTLRTALSWRLE